MRRTGPSQKTGSVSATVLITGAGARIGRHIALGLAKDDWTVIVHYNRSAAKAEELVGDIKASGGNAFALGANLSVPTELNTLINKACRISKSSLTALVNNASTFDDDRADTFTRGTYDHHMNVNLYAPIKLTQDFAAQLPDDETGAVINIIDQRVYNLGLDYLTYGISKSALYAATQTFAQALAPQIRVNGIGPGPTLQNKAQTDEIFEAERSGTLLGKGSPPDTIVQAVRYLLAAEAVTGQMIAVDGGQHLMSGQEA